jgi:ring-1,2-phenylacetyl-CoA epoxidase subunit PaaC
MDNLNLSKFCIRLGDHCLIMAHRQSELCSNGPFLEEDIAQINLGLDLLGQAEALLIYGAKLEGGSRTADDIAFRRPEREFYNFMLTEQPNTDFAFVIVRQYIMSLYLLKTYQVLAKVEDETLSGIALKALKELTYHERHFSMWLKRLGDGTEESHERAQTAINELWMFVGELYEEDEIDLMAQKASYAPTGAEMKAFLMEHITARFTESTLTTPEDIYMTTGSKKGIHTEYLGYLLTEMQYLQRAYPDAKW